MPPTSAIRRRDRALTIRLSRNSRTKKAQGLKASTAARATVSTATGPAGLSVAADPADERQVDRSCRGAGIARPVAGAGGVGHGRRVGGRCRTGGRPAAVGPRLQPGEGGAGRIPADRDPAADGEGRHGLGRRPAAASTSPKACRPAAEPDTSRDSRISQGTESTQPRTAGAASAQCGQASAWKNHSTTRRAPSSLDADHGQAGSAGAGAVGAVGPTGSAAMRTRRRRRASPEAVPVGEGSRRWRQTVGGSALRGGAGAGAAGRHGRASTVHRIGLGGLDPRQVFGWNAVFDRTDRRFDPRHGQPDPVPAGCAA